MLVDMNTTSLRRGVAAIGIATTCLIAAPAIASAEDTGLPTSIGESATTFEIGMGNMLLTNHGNSHSTGTVIDMWQRTPRSDGSAQLNQQWEFVPTTQYYGERVLEGGSWGLLRNRESNLCLSAPGTEELTDLTQSNCNISDPSMRWQGRKDERGNWALQLQAAADRYAGINVMHCTITNGERVRVRAQTAVGTDCGSWTLTRTDPRDGQALELHPVVTYSYGFDPGVRVDSKNSSGQSGTAAKLAWTGNKSTEQAWYLYYAGTYGNQNLYRLVTAAGGDWAKKMCLSAKGTGYLSVVETTTCNFNGAGQDNQLWFFEYQPFTHAVYGVVSGAGVYNLAALKTVGGNPYDLSAAPRLGVSGTVQDGGDIRLVKPQDDPTHQVWNLTAQAPAASSSSCVRFGCLFRSVD